MAIDRNPTNAFLLHMNNCRFTPASRVILDLRNELLGLYSLCVSSYFFRVRAAFFADLERDAADRFPAALRA